MPRTIPLVLLFLLVAGPLTGQKPNVTDLRRTAQKAVDSGRWDDASAAYRKLVEAAPGDGRAWHMLGYTLHAAGKLDEALKAHLKAREFPEVAAVATYNVACVYALRGDVDRAFAWLSRAVEAGFSRADHLRADPDMEHLRGDPRMKAILAALDSAAAKSPLRTYAGANPRQSFRVLFWRGPGSPGQVVIDYGQPRWRDELSAQLDAPENLGKRWRMGRDFWTTLDTNVDLTIGGVEVPAGYYYLTLEHRGERSFRLALLEPAKVRATKLDAFFAAQSEGGLEIDLKYREVEQVAGLLSIRIDVEDGATEGTLVVHFGPHTVSAPVAMRVTGG